MRRTSVFTILTFRTLFLIGSLSIAISIANAQDEVKVTAKTEAIALFKNGYTVVRQEIDVPGNGIYCWEEVPAVVHGTFFIESEMNVEVRTTQRLVSIPVDTKNPPRLAAGQEVTVSMTTPSGAGTLTGRIVDTMPVAEPNSLLPELTRSVARPRYDYYSSFGSVPVVHATATTSPTLNTPIVLEAAYGKHYFLTGKGVTFIETQKPITELMERRPVMIFHATKKEGSGGGKIRLFYLTKGATWAPSYRVDVLDGKRLRIEQATAIRNEGMPIVDTDISLVSGFPQIQSANILSPITPSQTLALFFQQVIAQANQPGYRREDMSFISNSAMMQQAIHPSATANAGFDTTALAAGEGPDIHYNAIGKRSLETGDTLSLTVGQGEADYRRVLECDLTPLVLNYYNEITRNWNNLQVRDRLIAGEVFDVLKFQNPLSFPMTTAPVTVTEKLRFLGQSQTGWVNPQQVASVKVTKVMNVAVTYSEKAVDVAPQTIQDFRGYNHIKRTVTGTIEIVNRRNEEITLHLNGLLLGKVGKIEPVVTKETLSAKDYYPNDLSDLFWELTLKPGESKTVTITGTRWFRY